MPQNVSEWIKWISGSTFIAVIVWMIKLFFGENIKEFLRTHGWHMLLNKAADRMIAQPFAGWNRLKQAWMVWLALGLTGGIAANYWVLPSPGGKANGAVTKTAGGEARETKVATPNTMLSALPNPKPPTKIGMLTGFEIIDLLRVSFVSRYQRPESVLDVKWALLLTVDSEDNRWLANLIITLLGRAGIKINQLPLPPASNLDAPKIPHLESSGIILHDNNSLLSQRISAGFQKCFVINYTQKREENVDNYYKSLVSPDEQLVWIEIGQGSPWRNSGICQN